MILERRIDLVSMIGIAFVVGWLSNSGYYNIAKLWQQKNQLQTIQTKTLPKLQALARCEHVRAEANEQIVESAAMGIKPLPGDGAPDCHHPKK